MNLEYSAEYEDFRAQVNRAADTATLRAVNSGSTRRIQPRSGSESTSARGGPWRASTAMGSHCPVRATRSRSTPDCGLSLAGCGLWPADCRLRCSAA